MNKEFPEFEVGDTVICYDPEAFPFCTNVTKGKNYRVNGVSDYLNMGKRTLFIQIENDNGELEWFYTWRFRLVAPAKSISEKPEKFRTIELEDEDDGWWRL